MGADRDLYDVGEMIVLIGSKGSMGKRYQAIFRWLKIPYLGFDLGDTPWFDAKDSDGIVIATPTPTHGALIDEVTRAAPGVPILCEKPLATNLTEVRHILERPVPLQMMAQYRYLDRPHDRGLSYYNYYASGSDGLAWDCVTILGVARGKVTLGQESPVWSCQLNGQRITREQVDGAYITAVSDWLRHPEGDREWLWQAHVRASAWRENITLEGPSLPGGTVSVPVPDAGVPKSRDDVPVTPATNEDHST